MNILPLSIVLHYCLTKTSDLTFIGCHNVRLQSCLMVVTTSMRAPSWRDDVRACAGTCFVPYLLNKFTLTLSLSYCGYGIFPSLRRAMSYPRTMSAYDLCISFPFSFISALWRHFFVPFPLSPLCILSCLLMSPRWIRFFLLLSPCWTLFLLGLTINPLIYLSIYPYIHLSIYQSIDLSIHRSIHLSIYPSIHLSIYPYIDLSIYQ